MKKTAKNSRKTVEPRKIDMAEHSYRLKALGLSERAVKLLVRVLILLVPVILIAVWFIKSAK